MNCYYSKKMNRKSQIFLSDTFLYFAYGGNMLTYRIHMHNPSAKFVSIGRLDNYRLDFIKYSSFWGGPSTTLVPTANAHVWGVIWRIRSEDAESLDEQKEIEFKRYYVKYLPVETPYMGTISCRSYIQKISPLPRGDNDLIPLEQWPSKVYKQVLIYGAVEHGIPDYYVQQLKKIKQNRELGAFKTVCLLTRYSKRKPCECRVPGRIPRVPLKLDSNKVKQFTPQANTFMYFAYGSNMWKKRIKIKVMSAEFLGIGRLDNNMLDFGNFSDSWLGALATIVPKDGEHVWGVIWRIHNDDKPTLESHGIDQIKYIPRTVEVVTPEGFKVECLTYQQSERPIRIETGAKVPRLRKPGGSYYNCILQGAMEAKLPAYYLDLIKKIDHTDKEACMDIQLFLI